MVSTEKEKPLQIIELLDQGSLGILHKIFHASLLEAERVVRREYAYSVEQSVERRVRYDHRYAIGELPADPVADLKRVGAAHRTVNQIRKRMELAYEDTGAGSAPEMTGKNA